MTRTEKLPLRTSYATKPGMIDHDLSSSSSTMVGSPSTPEESHCTTFDGDTEDVFMSGHTQARDNFGRLQYHEGRSYLPPLSEVTDQDSIYSQDSACVVYTSQLRPLVNPTPKSTLTFAAIWDPDHGMSTFSGNQLVGQEDLSRQSEDIDLSTWIQKEDNAYLSSFYYNSEHPDCEPHLASRFSTTTTSTSNYIDVDFNEQDQMDFSKSLEDDLLPGDMHPAWVPQIFSVGYIKPPSYGPKRPEISEPFQLTPIIRRDEVQTPVPQNTRSPSSAKSSSSSSLFSLSRSTSNSSTTPTSTSPSTPSRKHINSTHSSPTSSLRRGFSFSSHRYHSRSQSSSAPNTDEDESPLDGLSSAPSSFRSQSPTTMRRPSMGSVLGKLKGPISRKGSEDWVMVEVTPTIHQRIVSPEGS